MQKVHIDKESSRSDKEHKPIEESDLALESFGASTVDRKKPQNYKNEKYSNISMTNTNEASGIMQASHSHTSLSKLGKSVF